MPKIIKKRRSENAAKYAGLMKANVKSMFEIIGRIGEGTFSSVEKAKSLFHADHLVAIKRVYPTCSPRRLATEMRLLRRCGGKSHVASMYGAMFEDDGKINLILPYMDHVSFIEYLPYFSIGDTRGYMRALLESLSHLASLEVIHRDIKPSNFLFSPAEGKYMLVDFGLAEDEGERKDPRRHRSSQETIPANAPRAGTRGFRAPEVLLRCMKQTCAIDVWSAGVVLLTIMTGRFPFFHASEDLISLHEIMSIMGSRRMAAVARKLGKELRVKTEIDPVPLRDVVEKGYAFDRDASAPRARPEDFSNEAYDLLEKLLDPDPESRITAAEALEHPFFDDHSSHSANTHAAGAA